MEGNIGESYSFPASAAPAEPDGSRLFKQAETKKAEVSKKAVEKAAKTLTLRIPVIKKIATTAQKQEVIDRAVEELRAYISAIPEWMADAVSRIRSVQAASLEERAVRREELKELEDEVLRHLASKDESGTEKDELIFGAARLAYARAIVSTAPSQKRRVLEAILGSKFTRLPGLLDLNLVEEVVKDSAPLRSAVTVKFYGSQYLVKGKREAAEDLAKLITEAATRAASAGREFFKASSQGIESQADITLADFRAGTPGRAFLTVSDEKIKDERAEGGERMLPGGVLLVESNGSAVKVLQALGHFQRIMTEIAESGHTISVESLKAEKFAPRQRMDDPEEFRHCRILHAVLRRGSSEADKEQVRETRIKTFQAQCDAERVQFGEKATVSPADWLFEEASGTALIYLGRKPWVVKKGKEETPYFEVFFLVERTEKGVRIAEYPVRLRPLFGENFAEPADPGERFEGIRYPLGSMLRTAYAYTKAKADEAAEEERMLKLKAFREQDLPPADQPAS